MRNLSRPVIFTHLLDDYHRILANLNQPVRVIDGDRSFEGICEGD